VQIFRDAAFDPESLKSLCKAYDIAARMLREQNGGTVGSSEILARRVIDVAERGVHDPKAIARSALAAMSLPAAE
jgi:hypothetical protein